MNTDNPLMPQGPSREQKSPSRARVKVAVFVVLAIHGVGLLALLMQGCKPAADQTKLTTDFPTNPPPMMFEEPTNLVPPVAYDSTNQVPPAPTNEPPVVTETTPPPVTPPPVLPSTAVAEYTIAKGDTFAVIAKKQGISTHALMAANPGVEPTRLKIGQKIAIPPAGTTAPATGTPGLGAGAGTDTAAQSQTYTVKSGDTLIRIASQHGTTPKAIRAANGLKTDRIRVGQKLKLPAKAAASSGAATTTAPATPSNPGASAPPPAYPQ